MTSHFVGSVAGVPVMPAELTEVNFTLSTKVVPVKVAPDTLVFRKNATALAPFKLAFVRFVQIKAIPERSKLERSPLVRSAPPR